MHKELDNLSPPRRALMPEQSSCPACALGLLPRDVLAQAVGTVAVSSRFRYWQDWRKRLTAPARGVLPHTAFEHHAARRTLFFRTSASNHCAMRNTLHKVAAPNKINKSAANR